MIEHKEDKWDEFKDVAVTDWKRVRSAIEHENILKNQRVTWLLTSQAFLFAAYVLVFTSSTRSDFNNANRDLVEIVLASIALTAIFLVALISHGVRSAELHHLTLRDWWRAKYANDVDRHPHICGTHPKKLFSVYQFFIPLVFMPAWGILTLVAFNSFIAKHADIFALYLKYAIAAAILITIGILIGRAMFSKKA